LKKKSLVLGMKRVGFEIGLERVLPPDVPAAMRERSGGTERWGDGEI